MVLIFSGFCYSEFWCFKIFGILMIWDFVIQDFVTIPTWWCRVYKSHINRMIFLRKLGIFFFTMGEFDLKFFNYQNFYWNFQNFIYKVVWNVIDIFRKSINVVWIVNHVFRISMDVFWISIEIFWFSIGMFKFPNANIDF